MICSKTIILLVLYVVPIEFDFILGNMSSMKEHAIVEII